MRARFSGFSTWNVNFACDNVTVSIIVAVEYYDYECIIKVNWL